SCSRRDRQKSTGTAMTSRAVASRSNPRTTSTSSLSNDWRQWPPEAKARLRWRLQARSSQWTPPGDWYVWLILAGRGWGKTRTGAEDQAYYAITHPGARLAVTAPTAAAARDVCIEGESGLLNVIPPSLVRDWNRSLGEMVLTNGSRFKLFSADEPDR